MVSEITYSDDFCGIGGFRFAFDQVGGFKCEFSSETDKFARITYETFHGEAPEYHDINDSIVDRPYVDLFVGGFPCMGFSSYGVASNNYRGNPHGFEHKTYGTLFFSIAQILKTKQPKAFLLENVKNLLKHDGHKTFQVIKDTLNEVGYVFAHKVINASHWLPQSRERIYIVGLRKDLYDPNKFGPTNVFDIEYPEEAVKLSDILLEDIEDKYAITERTWDTLKKHKARHMRAPNRVGFGYSLIEPPFEEAKTRTLLANYYKSGAEILIWRGDDVPPRRLTPLECLRLQGFPQETEKWFDGTEPQPVSNLRAYKQFGNSVAVPVVKVLAAKIKEMFQNI
jgi:DNA (cytosine-5)-methyltransferase 1